MCEVGQVHHLYSLLVLWTSDTNWVVTWDESAGHFWARRQLSPQQSITLSAQPTAAKAAAIWFHEAKDR